MNYHRDIEDFMALEKKLLEQTGMDPDSDEFVNMVDSVWALDAPGRPGGSVPYNG